MIQSFNRQQIINGALRAMLAIGIYIATYYFFLFVLQGIMRDSFQELPPILQTALPLIPLPFIVYKGIQRWKMGIGNLNISEASIQLPESSGLMTNLADSNLRENTVYLYLLSSFFLAAPLQMMKAYDHFTGTIPEEHGLEAKLQIQLNALQQTNKWQDFAAYPGHERELIFLINMGKVDYSPAKGKIKIAG